MSTTLSFRAVRPRIAITLGDVAGIGPEVIVKAIASGADLVGLGRRPENETRGKPGQGNGDMDRQLGHAPLRLFPFAPGTDTSI